MKFLRNNKNVLNNEFNMEGCFVLNYEQLLNVKYPQIKFADTNDLMYITVAYFGVLIGEPVFNKEEISEIRWIGEDEIGEFEFCPGDVDLLKMGFAKI